MTAVEWFKERLKHRFLNDDTEANIFEKAKEMEKQQIIDAWSNGYDEEDRATSNPLGYYNETFKSE
jgi:hypothetical protein